MKVRKLSIGIVDFKRDGSLSLLKQDCEHKIGKKKRVFIAFKIENSSLCDAKR